jgi:predicted RNA-binding protein with PIN domain
LAAVASLVRPDGWAQLVAEVSAQWADERAGRDAAADEIARLRTELADLKARVKEQDALLDEATLAANAASAEEATRLRNMLRVRTGELRAATQALEQAQADAARERSARTASAAQHDAELERLRIRVAELEHAADTSRREARTDRDIDAARLRLLLDTMVDAATGIRRELALPAATLRPADAVAGGAPASDSAGVGEPVALERLLELPHVHVIVDGYNVTKTGYPDLSLADQRTRLISSLASLQSRSSAEVTVVFDGGTRPPAQPRTPRGVRVLFSAPDEIADDLIRRLVAAEPAGRALIVVTADQEIVRDARRAGAWTVASAVLLRRLG